MKEMKEKYINVFVKAFDLAPEQVGAGVAMGVTDTWDSVGHMFFITGLEDAFQISLEGADIIRLNSYENGIEILKKYGVEI